MYIINNIDRPLGINTYGILKKYDIKEHYTPLVGGGGVHYINIPDSKAIAGLRKVDIEGKDKNGNYLGTDGKTYDKVTGKIITTSKPQTFNTARPHKYDKSVLYRQYNGTWLARYTKGKDTNWYNVAENSTGYDRFGNHNKFVNGKWVKIKEDKPTGDGVPLRPAGSGTPQRPLKPRLDPNRFVSIYDTTGLWKQHAQDNNLTDRDSVRRFLKETLGFDDTLADGIWGKNTNAAYEAWKLKNSTPVVETVTTQTVLAPAVYQSTYDYNNADDFKNLGFNDYNSLKSWVKANPTHPFAKDMLERFKDTDLWTQNNIESDLGIKGKYRSGYQGDLYDIRKSMQNYFKNLYNIDKNNEYTTQILQNMNNMNNYVQNLANRFSFLKKQFKNGGQLVSCNPITRFKLNDSKRNFR